MQIFIARGKDSSGPFTLEQVQACLTQGTLLPDDLACHEELEDWIPLSELMDSISTPESTSSVPSTEKPTTIEEKPSVKRCIAMGILAFLFMVLPVAHQYWFWITSGGYYKLEGFFLTDGEYFSPVSIICMSLTSWAINNIVFSFLILFLLLLIFAVFMGGKRLYLTKKTCKWINISFWLGYMGIWLLYFYLMVFPMIRMMDDYESW